MSLGIFSFKLVRNKPPIQDDIRETFMGRSKSILALFIVCLLLMSSFVLPVFAQGTLSNLKLSPFDISDFPNVKTSLQAIGSDNEPITDLTNQSISVTEDGQPVQFSIAPYAAGIKVDFLIDAGPGLNSIGATGDKRINEMKAVIKSFISQMNISDSVMISALDGNQTNVINDFSSSSTDLQNALDNYQYSASQYSSGYDGILNALSMLNKQKDGKKQFIVFLSSGIQEGHDNTYQTIISQLTGTDHPTIHTLLFRKGDEDVWSPNLQELANLGGGIYSQYNSNLVTDSLYQSMGLWRNQYLITYRSTSNSVGNRQVVITTLSNNIQTTGTYEISLQPASVIIQDPVASSVLIRRPSTTNQSQSDTETDVSQVKVNIQWPDGHPRNITSVQLLAGNQSVGTLTNPSLDSTGQLEIPWDLRAFTKLGQNPISLQVQVTDEIGITGSSSSIPLIVLVQSNVCNGLPNFLCPAITFISPYANYLAMLIALIALILVIVFRKKIVSVGGNIIEKGITVIENTIHYKKSNPKAYLEVLEGYSERTRFEIYGNTPIGRDHSVTELTFQERDKNSAISKLHCTILDDDDGTFSIRDEDSSNGTNLNGKTLEVLVPEALHEGDIIELGQVERGGIKFRFSLSNSDSISSTLEQNGFDDDALGESEVIDKTKPRR
jgi:hypothetical protein